MKLCLLLILTLLLLSTPVFGELTNADLEKINTMLKESEARMKEHVSQEIAKVNLRIDALDKRLTSEIRSVDQRFDDMNKRLDNQFTLILALFAFLAVVIGIPQILVALQRRHQRAQDEKIEVQQQQIETLIAEIKTLKQQAPSS